MNREPEQYSREIRDAARRGRLDAHEYMRQRLSDLSATSRAFIASTRAVEAEQERIKHERTRLLEREREARAESEAALIVVGVAAWDPHDPPGTRAFTTTVHYIGTG